MDWAFADGKQIVGETGMRRLRGEELTDLFGLKHLNRYAFQYSDLAIRED